MFYAIFESGGKQFKAVEGSYVEVDHLPTEEGKKVSFDKVLLLVNDKETQVGTPYIKGASVDATVVTHFKGKKVFIFNYRPKKRYRVKTGHRQQYTRLMVNSIAFMGKQAKTVEEKPAAKVEKTAVKAEKPAAKPAEKKTTAAKPAATKKTTASTAKTGTKATAAAKAEKK
jgi:large subunit ribosomal protein L21